MKKGVTYRSFSGGMTGEKDPAEAIAEAREMGYQAIELATGFSGRFTIDADEAFCRRLAGEAKRCGIELSSLATVLHWECPLVDPDPAVRRRSIEATRRVLQQAAWLGVDAVLIIPGHVDIFWNPKAAVVLYELYAHHHPEPVKTLRPMSGQMKRTFHEAFDLLIDQLGLPAHKARNTKMVYRRIFGRAVPSSWEYFVFMGIVSHVLKKYGVEIENGQRDADFELPPEAEAELDVVLGAVPGPGRQGSDAPSHND